MVVLELQCHQIESFSTSMKTTADLQSVFKLNGNCNQWHRCVAEARLVQEILPQGGVIDSFAISHLVRIIFLINQHHYRQYDQRLFKKIKTLY